MPQPFSPTAALSLNLRKRILCKTAAPGLMAAVLLPLLGVPSARAAELEKTVPGGGTFGRFVSVNESGLGLVSAYNQPPGGYTYLYKNLDTATGTVFESAILLPSPVTSFGAFGASVSLSGNNAVIGANFADDVGAAYYYRNLGSATGTVTQDVKLISNDPAAYPRFGYSSQLSGNTAVVGALYANGNVDETGAAYVYRDLHVASGTVNPNIKLIASDGAASQRFGSAVSVEGNLAVVGADAGDGVIPGSGAAYVYRNLDTASGTVTEQAKLIASDNVDYGLFGSAVSVSGDMALIGANNWRNQVNFTAPGAAYLYRDLDTATGTVTESAKLMMSVPQNQSVFGYSVTLSGNVGLVGALRDNGPGAVFLFLNLDTATGTVNENITLTASNLGAQQFFGHSVDLAGDNIIIGSYSDAFTASLSSITKLDEGNATRNIDRVSFVSKEDWIIGQSTDNNEVVLTAGDAADVRAFSKAVYVGQNAGSDANTLVISGTLSANTVYIGSVAGNEDNTLQFDSTAAFGPVTLRLADDNFLSIQGNFTDTTALFAYLGTSTLQVWNAGNWTTVTSGNASSLISASFSSGYTSIQAGLVPEPSSVCLLILGTGGLLAARRRRSARQLSC